MDSSLREFDRISDRIKLSRQVTRAPAMIVEGVTDRRFISRIPAFSDVEIYIAHTRDVALKSVIECAELGLDRTACIVDRDFDDYVATFESRGLPVAAYDGADLESMLWGTTALEDLLNEVGSETKLHNFGGIKALRATVRDVLAPVARLRRASLAQRWGLDFDSVRLATKIDLRTLSIGIQSLCDALWHPDLGIEKADLYAAAQSQAFDLECPFTGVGLIRGRDALAVTGVALRRIVGSLNHQQADSNRMEEVLRLSVPANIDEQTTWCGRVHSLLAS